MKKIIIIIVTLFVFFGAAFLLTPVNSNYFLKNIKHNMLPEKCREQVTSSGNCFAIAQGYQYNENKKECEVSYGGGCSFNIPFETIEDCKKKCEKLRFRLLQI
ncbi:MAG: hypothetical protein WCW61_04480 [Patescibacteria group bacterium]|jgi:uncharacterized protein YxeA